MSEVAQSSKISPKVVDFGEGRDLVFEGDQLDTYYLGFAYGYWGDLKKRTSRTRIDVHGPFKRTDERIEYADVPGRPTVGAEVFLLGRKPVQEIIEIGCEIAQILRAHSGIHQEQSQEIELLGKHEDIYGR